MIGEMELNVFSNHLEGLRYLNKAINLIEVEVE